MEFVATISSFCFYIISLFKLFTSVIHRKRKKFENSGLNFIIEFYLFFILDEHLPSGHTNYDADSVSLGNDVYVRLENSFYQIVWNVAKFTWRKTEQELNDLGTYSLMMVLPNEYSCKGKLPMSLLGAEYMPLPLYLPYFDWGEINLPLPVKHSGFIKVIHGLQGF